MTDWAALRHAHGPADDIPGLLASAAADADDRRSWVDLWSRLCHQGTVYSASFPALPALTAMAQQHPAAAYVESLHLAAAIVASNDGPADLDAVRRDHGDSLAALRDLAERNLSAARTPADLVHALEALMAFEGSAPWCRDLHALADGELVVGCPDCGEDLTVSFETLPATTSALDDDLATSVVTPADPTRLQGAAARLHALALEHGQPAVADAMLHLFGTSTCPACGGLTSIPDALAR